MTDGGNGDGNGNGGKGKLPPGVAEQIKAAADQHLADQEEAAGEGAPEEEISEAQQAANTAALKLLLQAKLDEGVGQLRELAKKHDLIWPEDEDSKS